MRRRPHRLTKSLCPSPPSFAFPYGLPTNLCRSRFGQPHAGGVRMAFHLGGWNIVFVIFVVILIGAAFYFDRQTAAATKGQDEAPTSGAPLRKK